MISENKFMIAGAFVAIVVILVAGKKAMAAAGSGLATAGHALNPLNNDNIINQGANGAYQGVTGSEGSIGTDAYDFVQRVKGALNGDEETAGGVNESEQGSWF